MTDGVSGTKGGFNLEVSDGILSTGIGLMNVKVNSAGTQATHSMSNDSLGQFNGSSIILNDLSNLQSCSFGCKW